MTCITMKNGALIDKLVTLAGGDIDAVQRAVRAVAKEGAADLYDVVKHIEANKARD